MQAADVASFLEQRTISLAELQSLIDSLENPATRADACAMLHEIARQLERTERADGSGMRLAAVNVPGLSEPVRLLLHPAVFTPELWGKTFAEGLLKEPDLFHGTHILEIGTGSGWISLVLLRRTGVLSILGLDINPIAVAIARLNTWLNGSTRDGALRLSQAGIPVVEAFRSEVSDLLSVPIQLGETYNHIVGCIPQVLHPDPTSRQNRRLSTRDLYDLSNYCFEQGILEDRFGLPLIARALEQAQLCLRPRGLVTLILGGRPGQEAIESMFRRRGYKPQLWWSRRIQQADDTDLVSLVQLEEMHSIKFHFFMSQSSKFSIPASTAVGLLRQERPVLHDLLVYQAETVYERSMFSFVRHLQELGLQEMRKELDFSRIAAEQVAFAERLTEDLLRHRSLPYPHERGDLRLRERIARFLEVYCQYSVNPESLFVGPEQSQVLFMLLRMVACKDERVLVSASLESTYRQVIERAGCQAVIGNDDLPELTELDDVMKPRLCILAPYQMHADPSKLTLHAFIEQAKAHPDQWYIIDDSANFEIGSGLRANVMMRIIAQQQLPPNLIFLYGMIKSNICPDLVLTFMLNTPQAWSEALDVGAELTYSRISYHAQLYYTWLFDELLSFPFAQAPLSSRNGTLESNIELTDEYRTVIADPVFEPKPVDTSDAHVIRLDYGELEAPVPRLLVKGLVTGFLDKASIDLAPLVASRCCQYLDFTRHATLIPDRLVLGQGVFPLFGALLKTLATHLGRPPIVAVPHGSYGLVYPLAAYHGARIAEIETAAENGFRMTLQSLARLNPVPDLLWLTQPNNPSGMFFQADTVSGIAQLCSERGIYILADEIFFLLSEPSLGAWTPASYSFASLLEKSGKWLFLADGLSKAFAAGGLRCGFLVCPDTEWARQIQLLCMHPPQSSLKAWDSLYAVFSDESAYDFMDVGQERERVSLYLQNIREQLHTQRQQVLQLLRRFDLADREQCAVRGGLFLLAKLGRYARDLALETGVLLNSSQWSRTPEWSRLCFSIQPEKLDAALGRMQTFLERRQP